MNQYATVESTYSGEQFIMPTAIALGNFDGVHLGHQAVVAPILNYPNCCPTVVTFEPHPREFFSGQKQKSLTPTSEKVTQLKKLGITQVVLLPFDQQLAALSGSDFVEKILLQDLKVRCISVGENFCFGYQRQSTAADLEKIGSKLGIEVKVTKLKQCAEKISSSHIRNYLLEGEITLANKMLGRSYSLTGKVVHGQKLGRTLGFPTANLEIVEEKLLPRFGVYSIKVSLEEKELLGILNIGIRPTVQGKKESIEVHIFDWNADIYGKTLTVSLEEFIRPEIRFNSIEQLKNQIEQDCLKVKQSVKCSS